MKANQQLEADSLVVEMSRQIEEIERVSAQSLWVACTCVVIGTVISIWSLISY